VGDQAIEPMGFQEVSILRDNTTYARGLTDEAQGGAFEPRRPECLPGGNSRAL